MGIRTLGDSQCAGVTVRECTVTRTTGSSNLTGTVNIVSTFVVCGGCEVASIGKITHYAGYEVPCVLYGIDMVNI